MDCTCNDFDCDPCFRRMAAAEEGRPPRSEAHVLEARRELGWVRSVEDEITDEWRQAHEDGTGHPYCGREAALKLLRMGKTIEEAATVLGVGAVRLGRLFVHDRSDAASMVLASREMPNLECPNSYSEVASRVGLTSQQVQRFAKEVGISTRIQREGGGLKYTADQIRQVHELRRQGLSYSQIGMALPFLASKTKAQGVLKRHPLPELVSA